MKAHPFVANKKTAEERVQGHIKEGDNNLPKISEEDVEVEGLISLIYFSFSQDNAGTLGSTDWSMWKEVD